MGRKRLAPCLSPDRSVGIYRNPRLLGKGMTVPDGTVFVACSMYF
jgi:hypothetical protein